MKELALWWMNAKIGFSDVVSLLALLVSAGALWVSWHFGKPARDLARVSLKEKAAEAEAAKSANVVARLSGVPGRYTLDFTNLGSAAARNITVEWAEGSVSEKLFEHAARDFPYEKLRAGGHFSSHAVVYQDMPDRFKFVLSWDDDTERRKSEEQIVSRP